MPMTRFDPSALGTLTLIAADGELSRVAAVDPGLEIVCSGCGMLYEFDEYRQCPYCLYGGIYE
jgi:hypothetical protein